MRWKALLAASMIAASWPLVAEAQRDPRGEAAPPSTTAAPPRAPRSPARPRPTQSRYEAIPVSIHARDETGWDRAGSDEIFAVFRDPASNSVVRTTTFGNVDTGVTRYFAQAQACITPLGASLAGEDGMPVAWTCRAGGAATIAFTVELFEDDPDGPTGARDSYYSGSCTDAQAPANCHDDRIGRGSVAYTAQQLAEMLRTVGATQDVTLHMGGYDFTYRLVRLADVPMGGVFTRDP